MVRDYFNLAVNYGMLRLLKLTTCSDAAATLRIHPGESEIGLINFQNFDQKSQKMGTFDQKTSSGTSGPQVKFLALHESAVRI